MEKKTTWGKVKAVLDFLWTLLTLAICLFSGGLMFAIAERTTCPVFMYFIGVGLFCILVYNLIKIIVSAND